MYYLIYFKISNSMSIGDIAKGIVILAPNALFPTLFSASFAPRDLPLWLVQSCGYAGRLPQPAES